MPWPGTGTGAATGGVTARVGGLQTEGDLGCSKNVGEDEPGAGKGELGADGPGGSGTRDAAVEKYAEGAAAAGDRQGKHPHWLPRQRNRRCRRRTCSGNNLLMTQRGNKMTWM
jgi:hypothetical protein